MNNATCSDNVNSYTCTCVDGYTGTNCETGMSNFHTTVDLFNLYKSFISMHITRMYVSFFNVLYVGLQLNKTAAIFIYIVKQHKLSLHFVILTLKAVGSIF